MDVAYYPGCSLHGMASDYESSIKELMGAIGVNLVELKDWSCCGTTVTHRLNQNVSYALSASLIKKSEDLNLKDLFAPCASCYSKLLVTNSDLKEDQNKRKEIEESLSSTVPQDINILNLVDLISLKKEVIKEKIKKELKLKGACYYGCLLTRPKKYFTYRDHENPEVMEDLLNYFGVQTVNFGLKTECCGANLALSEPDVVHKLVNDLVDNARKSGADYIITTCPLCHANLDMRQTKFLEKKEIMPVIYLSQLIGLLIGIDYSKLGIKKHVTAREFLKLFGA